MTHTAGPWAFLESGSTEAEVNACRPLTICSAAGDDLANVYSSDDATVSISREEAIANAQLIAAAPELLAALTELLPMFDEWHSQFPQHVGDKEAPALRLARAAVAKATGAA